ncbi:DUF2339 domain-containing protein [Xanthomonas translucens pv. undulosa]|uniref:DUF2339 domain-containing protein n=1 Tax=Xanthomonas campestris pv. translucens TaxID=343 RepID=UPI0019D5ADEE|nr:DUF2339 domain-containing protein [Xanthomonas translucens]QSQ42868.1 DUF2339 domain-containing protein [Xanthomonas translucens pv. translucens]QSQ49281.1 DUF2339 domain-containing protein [Xanthomonas translucens pv. undulosa]WLA00234.1 DUF2339 domain-containing protein [Xanthomonas translucens]
MEALIVLVVVAVVAVPILMIVLWVALAGVRRRVAALELQLAQMRHAAAQAAQAAARFDAASDAEHTETDAQLADNDGVEERPFVPLAALVPVVPVPPPLPPPFVAPAAAASEAADPAASPLSPAPRGPDPIERLLAGTKRWFTEGNVPVKIGMLVLLAGVAALLKYAGDQGWLRMPIELRYAGIAAAALAGLGFGWRQRERKRKRSFALALQGGAIGVLLLTVFAAFKLSALLPAGAAFALSIVLVASMCVLAVVQESRTLAVLATLAGFLAPIWLSTGSGNHVGLFSYYAVLNAAVFAIAWYRPWRVLNLLGFGFTFGIGTLWGVLQYQPAKFASTEPFLLLFFAFYLLIPILYARRQTAVRSPVVDGSLLFGTPLVAFSLQAWLLRGESMPLALCALGLAAVYALLAAALIRRERYAVLGQAYALLAVGFATLAVPLALSARATASIFALEGAALVWLGLRQQRWLPQFSGAGLQLAAAIGFVLGLDLAWHDVQAVANATFMSGALLALAGLASAWSYRRAGADTPALAYYLWGLAWWCGIGVAEIERFVAASAQADLLLALVALSGWLAAEAQRRWPARALAATTLGGLLLALPLALLQADAHGQPFAGHGAWAWTLFAVLGVRSLICLRGSGGWVARAAQFAWWLVWPSVLSMLGLWLAQRFALAEGWQWALLLAPWLAAAAVSLLRWPWLAAPLGAEFDRCRTALQGSYFGLLGLAWLWTLCVPGASAPLPWVPLLNPLELSQLLVVALAARWLWSATAPALLRTRRLQVLAAAGFLWITSVTLHAVHYWAPVPWASLLSASVAQTSLTVVWSVLGVLGWVLGSRRGQRGLWLAGALLMAVVLGKLLLVDRGNLGNVAGIASFIAYGLLCTVVGYFAPAPPRAVEPAEEAHP